MILARRISGSVTQLIIFSKRVASGDFSARAEQSREHEFAILAHAMNQMAESVENSHVLLESSAGKLKHQATHDALHAYAATGMVAAMSEAIAQRRDERAHPAAVGTLDHRNVAAA